MLPDEIMGDASLLAQMNGVCASTGGSVVAVKAVPHDMVGSYGVIDPSAPVDADGVVPIGGMVEKPNPSDAPSDLIIIGRYVLTPDIFAILDTQQPGRGGEIQLTDAMQEQVRRGQPFHGVVSGIARRHRHSAGLPRVDQLGLRSGRRRVAYVCSRSPSTENT